MDCAFTEAHYAEIVQSFLTDGYRFVGYGDFVPGDPRQIILRHDVDLSLEDAVRIARLESQLGITSVYHILLTAEVYNPASAVGQGLLSELRSLGHRIGLHIDPFAIVGNQSDPAHFFSELKKLFDVAQMILGPVDSYSIHRPATYGIPAALHPAAIPFPVPFYANSAVYQVQSVYRTDSRREWHHGCICTQIPQLGGGSLHLVLHPIWWTPAPCTRPEILASYVNRRSECVEHYLESNLSFYLNDD